MKLKCLIVDDEPYAVELLENHIRRVPYLTLSHKCYNALEALDFIRQSPVDLMFLDINMPAVSGMQLASLLPPGQKLIFTTAYSDYAVESYEHRAVDYLLKPITFERFLKAVQRVAETPNEPKPEEGSHFFVKCGRSIVKLEYDAILFIKGLKDYVVFHTTTEKHVVHKRMKDLESSLPERFFRVHHSYIVNRDRIDRIEDRYAVIASHKVPVSESYWSRFSESFRNKLS